MSDKTRDALVSAISVTFRASRYRNPTHGEYADAILASGVLDEVKADAWDEGYRDGVGDEATSQDWTNGQTPPARANPYRSKEAAR